jgi:hypothetical protein
VSLVWMVDEGAIPPTPKSPPIPSRGLLLDLSRPGCCTLTLLPQTDSAFVRPLSSLLRQFTSLALSRFVVLSHRFVTSFCHIVLFRRFSVSFRFGFASFKPLFCLIVLSRRFYISLSPYPYLVLSRFAFVRLLFYLFYLVLSHCFVFGFAFVRPSFCLVTMSSLQSPLSSCCITVRPYVPPTHPTENRRTREHEGRDRERERQGG